VFRKKTHAVEIHENTWEVCLAQFIPSENTARVWLASWALVHPQIDEFKHVALPAGDNGTGRGH